MISLHLEGQGETLTFFSEPDSSAPMVEFECAIAPGKNGPDPHIHPLQSETFRVTQGRMRAVVDGEARIIEEGGTIVVKPGQVHTFSNPDPDRSLTMRITVAPALNFQWFLTEAARSAIRNGGRWKDAPLLEMACILEPVMDEHDFPGLPPAGKRLLFRTLARLGSLLGKAREIAPMARTRTPV